MASKYRHTQVNGVGLFATNTKTHCPSWAISQLSCSGAKGCEICKNCYAKRGKFGMGQVKNALLKRHEWFQNTSENEVVKTIVEEIEHFGEEYFRTHVAGDFQNVRSIRIWKKIAEKTKAVKFWFPTKAYRIQAMVPHLKEINKLDNVAVRPSATDFDVPAPEVKGLSAGATAYRKNSIPSGHFDCPGDCKDCRVCWDKDIKVAYHYH